MVAGQKAALSRIHAGQTVTVLVSDTTSRSSKLLIIGWNGSASRLRS
jgi:hypothetical protein